MITFLQLTGLLAAFGAGLLSAKPIIIHRWHGWAWRLMPAVVFGALWIAKAATILGWPDVLR